ncbi:MAG: STM3941 family protein [Flavobacteriaceae bacterium]
MKEVKLYKSYLRGLLLILISALFVFVGYLMIIKEDSSSFNVIMGWVCVCFFGLGIPVGFFHLFDRRPQIIITESGIWDRTTREDEIKWEQIIGAYPLKIQREKFVSIIVDETFVFKSKRYKWAEKIVTGIGGQKLNLHLGQLKVNNYKLVEFINEIKSADFEKRKYVIKKYFSKYL